MANETQQNRINNGLCPNCGKDAAPYYLCWDCRALASLGRALRRMEKHKFVKSEKSGRSNLWFAGENKGRIQDTLTQAYPVWGEGKGDKDKRLRPRLRGVPVDVEATLIEIFKAENRGLTLEEIHSAWGRLRSGRPRESAASDMMCIIMADRKREQKRKKLVEHRPGA